jgi:hypothetical protein
MDAGSGDPAALASRAMDLYAACEREAATRYHRLAASMEDAALTVLLRRLLTPGQLHAAMDRAVWEKYTLSEAAASPSAAPALAEYGRRREASRPEAIARRQAAWLETMTARAGDRFALTGNTVTTLDLIRSITPQEISKGDLSRMVQAMCTLETAAQRVRRSDGRPDIAVMHAEQYLQCFRRELSVPVSLRRAAESSPFLKRRTPLRDPFLRAWCIHLWQYFMTLYLPAWLDSQRARHRAARVKRLAREAAGQRRQPGGKARAALREFERYRTFTAAFRAWATARGDFPLWLRRDTADPGHLIDQFPKQPAMRELKGRNFLRLLHGAGHDPDKLENLEIALLAMEIPLKQEHAMECVRVLFGEEM